VVCFEINTEGIHHLAEKSGTDEQERHTEAIKWG